MTPIFTGKGDKGQTGFLGSGKISKNSARIEAVGSVDEAAASLGYARALTDSEKIKSIILQVQKQLYVLMSEISTASNESDQFDKITENDLSWLENQIKDLEDIVEMPGDFIIPGESPASSALAVARTVVRRAERRTITLLQVGEKFKPILIAYLNRLSSLIFVLEVYETSLSGRGLRLAKED
ncbi:MAG: cob(I)yrinic acid a,c-diamide adenosyltransferase [Chloroflexota bacterium]|nr:cob(I)yrinic acid a,c-diamide adenosyltransferase [Chloroflexota bacterium]